LDSSQEKDFPQRNLLQRSSNTLQEYLSRALFPLEVAPAEFYCTSLSRMSVQERAASELFCRSAEVNFPERKPSVVCSSSVLQIFRAPGGLM
jgi:hypothetical protein